MSNGELINKEQGQINENSSKDIEEFWLKPIRYWNFDADGNWEIEIHIPGVKKDSIKLKILNELYDLKAKRGNVNYTLTEYFPCNINPDSIDARYDNGLLYIKGKVKDPMDDAVEIKL